jgi:hypothetical protein
MDSYDAKIPFIERDLKKLEELVSWVELFAQDILLFNADHYLDIRSQCEVLLSSVERIASTISFLRSDTFLWDYIQSLRYRLDLAGVEILHHANNKYDAGPLVWGFSRYKAIDLQNPLFAEVGFGFISLLTTLFQQLKNPGLGRQFVENEIGKNRHLIQEPRRMYEYLIKRARSDVHGENTREIEKQLSWLEAEAGNALDPTRAAYNVSVVKRLFIEHELFRSRPLRDSRARSVAKELQDLGEEAVNKYDFKMLHVITIRGLVRMHILQGDLDLALQDALEGELKSGPNGYDFPIEQYRFRNLINLVINAEGSSLARRTLQEMIRTQRNY